ncbi:MAG TPA: SRPBCC family protein [Acidimicrobiia bacterium]|nr:SRPBCC family protein [Acidimicrobiia bacterium]
MRTRIDRTGSAEITLPSETEISMVRKFDAPAELVFDVWTTPEHVRNWWGYPEHQMTECTIDLTVGGEYRYAADIPDFGELAFRGVFKEIDRPHRLVATEIYEAYPDKEGVNTMTLTEEDGVTTMVVIMAYDSQETRDAVIESGMEHGLQVSLNRIDAVLAGLNDQGEDV